jgi:hypothetical protein
MGYIRELIADDYFKTKREIGEVRDKLEEDGQHLPRHEPLDAPLPADQSKRASSHEGGRCLALREPVRHSGLWRS